MPAQEAPVYIAAKADASKSQEEAKSQEKDRVFGTCSKVRVVEKDQTDPYGYTSDVFRANVYMGLYENKPDFFGDGSHTTVRVIQQPAHGYLKFPPEFDPDENEFNAKGLMIEYIPDVEYVGMDSYVIEFEQEGEKVKVKSFVMVDYSGNLPYMLCETAPGETKEGGEHWRISPPSSQSTDDLVSWLRSNLLRTTQIGFADLPRGGIVAQTTGTGLDARITLDIEAAGYEWFTDYTPFLSDEYLPTNNPNEWIAKSGSKAEGKMDMLSVLLHEYGHALGIEHSGDTHDFMSAALQPGVRRLPSAEELQHMANLVFKLKDELGLGWLSFYTPEQIDTLLPPTFHPVTAGFNAFSSTQWHYAEKKNDTNIPTSLPGTPIRYEVAANPVFIPLPSAFPSPIPYVSVPWPTARMPAYYDTGLPESGWLVTGDVSFGNGSAVLKETGSTQTRLNQIFVLGEKNRVLSFTQAIKRCHQSHPNLFHKSVMYHAGHDT